MTTGNNGGENRVSNFQLKYLSRERRGEHKSLKTERERERNERMNNYRDVGHKVSYVTHAR